MPFSFWLPARACTCLHRLARACTGMDIEPTTPCPASRANHPPASATLRTGGTPCGLLTVKYKEPLFEFKRRKAKNERHASRTSHFFGSPCWARTKAGASSRRPHVVQGNHPLRSFRTGTNKVRQVKLKHRILSFILLTSTHTKTHKNRGHPYDAPESLSDFPAA